MRVGLVGGKLGHRFFETNATRNLQIIHTI